MFYIHNIKNVDFTYFFKKEYYVNFLTQNEIIFFFFKCVRIKFLC